MPGVPAGGDSAAGGNCGWCGVRLPGGGGHRNLPAHLRLHPNLLRGIRAADHGKWWEYNKLEPKNRRVWSSPSQQAFLWFSVLFFCQVHLTSLIVTDTSSFIYPLLMSLHTLTSHSHVAFLPSAHPPIHSGERRSEPRGRLRGAADQLWLHHRRSQERVDGGDPRRKAPIG